MLLAELMEQPSFKMATATPSRAFVNECSEAFLQLGVTNTPPPQAREHHPTDQLVRICSACNGYYGPAFWQPVCATCHAFLYANDLDAEINLQIMSQAPDEGPGADSGGDDSDKDSGNEEPTDQEANPEDEAPNQNQDQPEEGPGPLDDDDEDLGANVDDDNDEQEVNPEVVDEPQGLLEAAGGDPENSSPDWIPDPSFVLPNDEDSAPRVHPESLSQRLAMLSFPRPSDELSEGIVEKLPTEVLLFIFSFLDDVSLYAVGHTCRRWHNILRSQFPSEHWQIFTRRRWPLFHPISCVPDWYLTYSALVESSFCVTCIYQMAEVMPADQEARPLRERRLVTDLRLLIEDPPPGIRAQPLDSSNYHWQASLTGPVGSPYEGGVFFLYVKVPFTYPFNPPEVRFLTKIFHPNVSRHGDIGIDSILQHNWVSGLTIPKILLSIQSLLTDPYCNVCMEPEIGELHRKNRPLFDAIARKWTWQFAMHDAIPPRTLG